tara:strand:- start:6 stop:278 length:273 start_codon:yes stop_codon:yes gene_type:complete
MKPFNEFNERLDNDGSDDELQGVNDEGLNKFQDEVKVLWDASFGKKGFQTAMEQSFYRSQDWPKDAKQVGKTLEQIDKAIYKVSKMIERW